MRASMIRIVEDYSLIYAADDSPLSRVAIVQTGDTERNNSFVWSYQKEAASRPT